MATELDLRSNVLPLLMNLTRGADFIREIVATAPGFSAGDELEIRFSTGQVWPATIDIGTSTASWIVDATVVEAVIESGTSIIARLFYKSGDVDLLWAMGKVSIDG